MGLVDMVLNTVRNHNKDIFHKTDRLVALSILEAAVCSVTYAEKPDKFPAFEARARIIRILRSASKGIHDDF
jgi:hypothetical protein